MMPRPTIDGTAKTSNLIRFLQCVTPIPSCRFLAQDTSAIDLNNHWQPLPNKAMVEYFTLADLWACYDEFSAYGAGTEVSLEYDDNTTQYYIPYLSAIQLYTNKSISTSRKSPSEFENNSWDEDSRSEKLSGSLSGDSVKTCDSISNDNSNCDESSLKSPKLGSLYFHYIEMCSPYSRVPLREKISELAKLYPGLMTFKNVDLSPASWMAVAWYPIYHIPSRRGEKDLDASFLTFHTLSSSFKDCGTGNENNMKSPELVKTIPGGVPLPPFGLATYKVQGDIWLAHKSDYEKAIYLQRAADSWLKQLNVYHHDFNFFTSRFPIPN
ncbi:unnamed protein product [Linum tenue]|uniref:Uncharacterized protein n=1 Tax=Linum tenue TaxID=586396 RepID=A0AAV0Q649_9ROSI|nr:unnamed protein product [Linum tenue]